MKFDFWIIAAISPDAMFHWLVAQVRTLSAWEWAGALTGIVCIYLTLKNRISNWPWSIVSVLLYTWVFWMDRLYANAGLQLFCFLPLCVYGWWAWAKTGPLQQDDLPITRLSPAACGAWLAASFALSVAIGQPIALYTHDAHPWADSFTTGFSIVAQYLQARKVYENWWIWIAVDGVFAFYLLPVMHMWPSVVLYVLAFAMAIGGARSWKPLIGKHIIGGGTKTEDAAQEEAATR